MAQLAIAAVGAAIGNALVPAAFTLFGTGITAAQIGWTVGSLIGASFGPTQRGAGPRLTDLKVTGAEYGQPIPWAAGHPRIAGQLWWASEKREIATTQETGGKGGGGAEYTTYTYEIDLLIGLLDRQIAGISRVWSNGKLVYTKLATSGVSSALSSKSQNTWRRMTVYTGSEDQLPDPTYETAVGVGNAPAYRDRGTVFLEGLQLGNSGQLPNLTFEVYMAGDEEGRVPETLGTFDYSLGQRGGIPAMSIPSFTHHFQNTVSGESEVWRFTLGLEEMELENTYTPSVSGQNPSWANSDVSGQFLSNTGSTQAYWYDDDGTATSYTLPYNINNGAIRVTFCRHEDVVLIGSTSDTTGDERIYKFSTAGGTSSANSSPLPEAALSIAIAGSNVYVLDSQGSGGSPPTAVYVLDLATLTLQDTLTPPAGTDENGKLMADENGLLYIFTGNAFSEVYRLDGGSTWTLVKTVTGGIEYGQLGSRFSIQGGDLWAIVYPGGGNDNELRVVFDSVDLLEATLQETVDELCIRAGLDVSQWDSSALAAITKPVRALTVAQVSPVRQVLEQLAAAYFFDCYLADKLYFVPRGGSVAATPDVDDLGCGEEQAAAELLPVRVAHDSEIPAQISLSYANADADYNTATEHSDRLATDSTNTATVQMPMAFTSSEGKGIVDAMLADAYFGRISGEVALPMAYGRHTPTDVLVLTDADATTYRARLVRREQAGPVIKGEWVLDDTTALISAGITSVDYTPSLTVQLPGPTSLSLLDIPILRDADDSAGIYAVVKPTGTVWPGAVVMTSVGGTDYTEVGTITSRGVFGLTTTALTSYSGGSVFDEASSVTVDVGEGTLSSATRAAMLDTGANAMLVASEIIQFRTATLQSAGIYTLTGLLRGRRGTEWAMTGHAIGDTVVLLRTPGMLRVGYDAARIGQSVDYKAVTLGRTLASASTRSITDTGIALKPFSPQDVRAERDTITGDIELSFRRRSRLSAAFLPTGGVPLGEDAEAYEVDVYSDSGYTTLVRTITASESPAVYTAEQQAADFGSLPTAIWVKVYQVSGTVGRGYAATAAIAGLTTVFAVSAYYDDDAVGGLIASGIDTRTSGAILFKQLMPPGVGAPNEFLLAGSDGVAYALNTSGSLWKILTDVTVSALGMTPGADHASAVGQVVAFLDGAGVFERVEWTGDGSGARDIPHSLGVAPVLALVKRNVSEDWWMYSSEAGAAVALRFPSGGAGTFAAAANAFPSLADTTDLKVGSDLNANGVLHCGLLFADDGSDVDAGTYTGNGTGSGPTVSLPWEPDILIIRNIDGSAAWTFIRCAALADDPDGATHWLLDDQGTSPAYSAIVTVGVDSFQPVSSDATVNESGITYQYWARKR